MEWTKFEKPYKIHLYETGPDGRSSLYAMLNYMQDIASDHAVLLGFGREDLNKNNHIWVLSRMYAEFHYWPLWEEEIIVTTFPNGTDKFFAMRNYEVISADGKRIAEGTSSWLIIDKTTKKIQRPDQQHERFKLPFNSACSSARAPEKLQEVKAGNTSSVHLKVKVSDLDINLHTNNVNYIQWVCDSYDLDFILKHRIASVEINYLAESVFANEITIKTSESDTTCLFNHSIWRKDDNRELCRVRINWEKIL